MENVAIEWKMIAGKNCLYFKFGEQLTAAAATYAAARWKAEIISQQDTVVCLVWDCLRMKGYEKEAREIWQATMKELRSRMGCVWIITTSLVVSVGASVLSTFSQVSIKTAKTLAEVTFKE